MGRWSAVACMHACRRRVGCSTASAGVELGTGGGSTPLQYRCTRIRWSTGRHGTWSTSACCVAAAGRPGTLSAGSCLPIHSGHSPRSQEHVGATGSLSHSALQVGPGPWVAPRWCRTGLLGRQDCPLTGAKPAIFVFLSRTLYVTKPPMPGRARGDCAIGQIRLRKNPRRTSKERSSVRRDSAQRRRLTSKNR